VAKALNKLGVPSARDIELLMERIDTLSQAVHKLSDKAPAKTAAKVVPKNGVNPNFGMNMPMMCSAFDTSMWLNAA
jgi:hypothetical protein